MNLELFNEIIRALRAELQEYGGLIALLDQQQDAILRGEPDEFVDLGNSVHDQVALLGAHRSCREKTVAAFARHNGASETSTVAELIPHMPENVGSMVKAIIEEINTLITRTQRRLRQNHLLLARCVSTAQQRVVIAGGGEMVSTYGRAGAVKRVITGDAARLAVA